MKNSASPIWGIFITTIFLLFTGFSSLIAQTSSFSINTPQQCISNPSNNFIFTNTSTGIGNTYSWNFGDGTTSNATSPSKVYTQASN